MTRVNGYSSKQQVLQYFLSKVDKTPGYGPWGDCWLWTGTLDRDGYGTYSGDFAHRRMWKLHKGPIPPGMCVCHKCDNPPCVNPKHLFLGTHQGNMDDKVSKGRQATTACGNRSGHHARGEQHGRAKLTDETVRQIRTLGSTLSRAELARQFGVGWSAIHAILQGKRWQHVDTTSAQC